MSETDRELLLAMAKAQLSQMSSMIWAVAGIAVLADPKAAETASRLLAITANEMNENVLTALLRLTEVVYGKDVAEVIRAKQGVLRAEMAARLDKQGTKSGN